MKKCLAEILVLMMILTLACGAWAEGLIIEEDWTDERAIAAEAFTGEDDEDEIISENVELEVPEEEEMLLFGDDDVLDEFSSDELKGIEIGVSAGEGDSYSTKMREVYSRLRSRRGSSYSGYCGQYVLDQLNEYGIGYVTNGGSCHGNTIFHSMVDGATTSGGYKQVKYSGNNAINEIINVNGSKVENIVISLTHQYSGNGYSDANPGYGHTLFINVIYNGNVYFTESFNGYGYSEGEPQIISLSDFIWRYNHYYGNIIGAVHYTKEQPKTDYTVFSYEAATYTVKQDFNLKFEPSSNANTIRKITKGSTVKAKKIVVNKYNNIWVELDGGGYVFGGLKLANNNLSQDGTQYLSYSGDNASISISGESIPSGNLSEGAGFELKGNISSSNSIHSVTAEVYSGSSKVATSDVWYSGNKTTTSLNIQPSIVNTTLKFGKLSPGNYTFKLNVTYYYNRSTQKATKTIRSSDFSIGGGSNPDPAPAPATDDKWVYRVKTSDGLNMRNAAGTGGSIVATLWNPTTITVTKKQNSGNYTWGYGTSSDGHTGWVVVDNNWTEPIPQPEHQPSDTTAPVISDIHATNVTSDGFTLSCTVSDDVGVTKVEFPTWTEQNGQDDLIWHSGTLSGNTASFTLNVSEHNYERDCNYITDIYAYDAAGNHGVKRAEIQIVSPKVEPSSVSLNKTSASMQIGATMRLSATVYPNGVDTTLQWASSNSSVVIVDCNGIVAAVGKGTASITATTENGLTDTCEVTVTQPKKVKGFKLVAGRKQITVVWTQASGVSGYQIEYSTSSKFTNAKRVKVGRGTKIETGKAVKKVIKSLKTKKTYYVRIRAYKKVNNVNYYSDWSKVLKKKTK